MKLGFTKVNSSTLVSVITVQPSLNLEFQYSWKNIFMSLYTLHEKKGKKKPFLYEKTCMKLLSEWWETPCRLLVLPWYYVRVEKTSVVVQSVTKAHTLRRSDSWPHHKSFLLPSFSSCASGGLSWIFHIPSTFFLSPATKTGLAEALLKILCTQYRSIFSRNIFGQSTSSLQWQVTLSELSPTPILSCY